MQRVERLFNDLSLSDDLQGEYSEDPHRAPAYRDDREWFVLGGVVKLLLDAGRQAPVTAEKQDPKHKGNDPDFVTFRQDGTEWLPVEVCETVHPDYANQRRMLKQFPNRPIHYDSSGALADPWKGLQDLITKKARKAYAPRTCLLVYYDIGPFPLRTWNAPVIDKLMSHHASTPFQGIDAFRRVLVLSADMNSLAELHPNAETIVRGRH